MTTKLVLVAAVLLAACFPGRPASAWQPIAYWVPSASLQQEDGWAALKLDEGILFVWNRPDLHFTLIVRGKEIKPLNDPDHIFFNVDDKAFQIQLASIAEFAPDAKEKKLDDKSILAAHRDWETTFLEGLLHSKLKVQVFSAKLSSGSAAALWQFDMPDGMNADAKKQIYLTVVSKPYVLLLNGVATTAVSDDVTRKYLLDTMATLKISSVPIDVKKLSESVRKGVAP
jgi:hypothetical protein